MHGLGKVHLNVINIVVIGNFKSIALTFLAKAVFIMTDIQTNLYTFFFLMYVLFQNVCIFLEEEFSCMC